MQYTFDTYALDLRAGTLTGPKGEVRLRPKTFDLLCELVRRAGQVVSKKALFAAVWGADVYLSDDALTQAIGELRRALGDSARPARFIETLHRRGYRWCTPTAAKPAPDEPAVPAVVTAPPKRIRPRYWWGAAAVAVLAVGVLAPAPPSETSPLPRVPRLAVLDLEPEQAEAGWLCTGIAELLATDIERRPDVTVYSRPRLAAMARDLGLGGTLTPVQVAAVGRYLDADFVAAGTCRVRGGEVDARLVLHGIRDGSAQPLAERFPAADLVQQVESWRDSVVEKLLPGHVPLPTRHVYRATPIAAFHAYFTARRLEERDPRRALQLLDEAVALERSPSCFHQARARVLAALGQSERAVDAARLARDLQPKHHPQKEATYLQLAGKLESALAVLARVSPPSREPDA